MLGRWRGVLIHRTRHGRIGGQRLRLPLHSTMSSMADGVGVLHVVWEPMCHAHLLRHLIHHTLGTMEVDWSLLGVTVVLALGLCDLYLSRLRLLQHGLTSSMCHHLERDDGWQLLSAHGDIHRCQHWAPAVTHARVRSPHLVWYEAEQLLPVGVLGHADPTLLLSQHVADRG